MSEHGLSVGKIPTAIIAARFRSHNVPSHRCFDAVGWATSTGSQAVCENLLWKFQIFAFCQSNLSCNTVEWLACWLRHRRAWVQIAAATLSGNSLRQTVHTHCASVHQAAKLVAALLRVARVTAGVAESNGSLPPGLWLASPAGWLPRTGISSGTIRSVMEYGLPLPFLS